MSLSLFETIAAVLTEGIGEVCRADRIEEDEAINMLERFLRENSEEYYSDSPNLRYDSPLCRLAYIYAYVAAHANIVSRAVFNFSELRTLLDQRFESQGKLSICALGGGPGSELLGLAQYFYYHAQTIEGYVDLDFQLVDKVNGMKLGMPSFVPWRAPSCKPMAHRESDGLWLSIGHS
jgi:hypothetical protein